MSKIEDKIWGAGLVKNSPTSLGALRFEYFLSEIVGEKGKLLDIGCGAGSITKAIAKNKPRMEVWGIDTNSKSIRLAKKNSFGVKFQTGNAYKLPFKNKFFDFVVFFDLLEHVERPELIFREISRVLKKGGILHCFVPIEGNLVSLHGVLLKLGWWPKKEYAGHIQAFKMNDLENIFRENNFSITGKIYSAHFINQFADMFYFSYLSLVKKELDFSLESYLEISKKRKNLTRISLGVVKDFVALASYWESKLLYFFPGAGVHITAVNE